MEHLQRAAHELIAAARTMLDVADDVVRDPSAVGQLVDGLASVARVAGFTAFAPGPPTGPPTGPPPEPSAGFDEAAVAPSPDANRSSASRSRASPKVTRIRVS